MLCRTTWITRYSSPSVLLYREYLTSWPVSCKVHQLAQGSEYRTRTIYWKREGKLTGPETSRWVSALRASVLLDVVRGPATTTAQRVRLVVALSKA